MLRKPLVKIAAPIPDNLGGEFKEGKPACLPPQAEGSGLDTEEGCGLLVV